DGEVLRSKGDALRLYTRLPILSGACDNAVDTTGVNAADPTKTKLPDAACPTSGSGA
ncbi:MAG: hypothetical protein H7123_01655, partial [Thermoleophilia bacterium]|nr:hypothetical protein [Thermoleophilia bacterium]